MNKLTKLLSVFILAGAVGAGVAGVAGCTKKDDGNNGGGHTHNYTWVNDNNGKCHEHCGVAGCDTPDKPAQDHVDTKNNETQANGADGKCDHCGATLTPSGALAAPAGATGIIVEYEGEDVELSMENKTASIDTAKVKVYFEVNSAKGTAVPAANYDVEVYKDGDPISTLTGLKQGNYEISVTLKNVTSGGSAVTWDNMDQFVITNPVVANSLVVKTGATLTQVAGVDTISSSWTYEVTLANGDKQDVPAADVTVSGLETMTAGENKTATLSCTIDNATVTGTVTYSITRDANKHTESIGYVFGAADLSAAVATDTVYKQGETVNVMTVKQTGGKVEAHSSKAEESELTENGVTQKFYYRYAFGGGTFQSDKALHANNRWLDITTTGAGVLTVYYSTNGGTDSITASGKRGVAVYTGTMGNYETTTCIGSDTASDKAVHKLVVNIPAAGTYHIGTAGQAASYLLGVKLDTIVESAGEDVGLPTDTEAMGIELSVEKTEADGTTNKVLKSGQKFASWVTGIKQIMWNPVTGVMTKQDISDISGATYTLKTSNMAEAVAVTAETDLTDAMVGDATITVTIDGKSNTYSAVVESTVAGVKGVTANLNSELNTQVEGADGTLTLKSGDIVVAPVWTSDEVTGVTTEVVVKDGEEVIDATTGKAFAIGTHTITVEITVKNADNTQTATFTKEVTLIVTKKPVEGEAVETKISFDGVIDNLTADTDVNEDKTLSVNGTVVNSITTKSNTSKVSKYKVKSGTEIKADGASGATIATVNTCFGTNGGIKANQCSIEVDLKAGNYNITIYSKQTGTDRVCQIIPVNGSTLSATTINGSAGGTISTSDMNVSVFEGVSGGGKIYIGGNNNIDIYYIVITPVTTPAA